jgi:hypothetical protein
MTNLTLTHVCMCRRYQVINILLKCHCLGWGLFMRVTLRALRLQNHTHTWSWALLEKPPTVQLLKNFPAFYGTRSFITVLTRALHWSLYWATSIQSIPSHLISLRPILILSTHLRLGLPSGSFRLAFPPISYMQSSSPPFVLHVLPISCSLTWSF